MSETNDDSHQKVEPEGHVAEVLNDDQVSPFQSDPADRLREPHN